MRPARLVASLILFAAVGCEAEYTELQSGEFEAVARPEKKADEKKAGDEKAADEKKAVDETKAVDEKAEGEKKAGDEKQAGDEQADGEKADGETKAAGEKKPEPVVTVAIDREASSITVTVDGTATTKKYTPRPREQWPRACPMNFNSFREELADIEGPLTIGAVTLQKPMLLALCPSGLTVMITEAREFEGHRRDCPPESCFEFSKK